MKKNIFKLIFGIFSVISIGFYILLLNFNKPYKDIRNAKPDLVINASSLMNEYVHNENSANKKCIDHIIQIKGEIFDISALNGNSIITLSSEGSNTTIICHLAPEENIQLFKLKKGQEVIIKGVCNGFLMDVIMVNCVIMTN